MAKGDTKTQQYLGIAANGAREDLQRSCCDTRTQSLVMDVAERIITEEETRAREDAILQGEIDTIRSNPDVFDIVGTYQDLQNYDKSTLTDKDVIRVLSDSTHGNLSTYYRYSSQSDSFTYIGTATTITYAEKVDTDRFNVIDNPISTSIKTIITEPRTVVRLFVGKENYYPFPYYDSSKAMNGVTWTVNADGTVTANGTATADSIFTLYYTATEPTPSWLHDGCKWYLKACDGGSATTYYAKHVASGVIQTNDPVNMFNTVSPRVDLYIASGYTANNVVFSPRVTCDPTCVFSPLGKLYEATVTTSDTEYQWPNIAIEKGDIVLPQKGDYLETDTIYDGAKLGGEQWRYKNLSAFGTSITDTGNSPNAHDPNGDPTGKYLPFLIEKGKFAPLNHLPSQTGDIDRTKSTNFGIAGGGLNGQILYYIRYYLKDNVNKGKRGDNCDLVTIEGSVNDFYNACPLGNVGDTVPYTHNLLPDSTADGTFAGACYCCFTEAIQNAPRATVVFITESTGKNVSGGQDFSWGRTNSAGLKQIDYINMAKAVAKYVGIPVIEAGQDSSINNANPQFLVDHIHHTYLGGKQYADAIWEQLKNIPNKDLVL